MRLVDIVEDWAKARGWWTYKNLEWPPSSPDKKPYINIGKNNLGPEKSLTLWDTGDIETFGSYRTKLNPADPDFFLNLEFVLIERT